MNGLFTVQCDSEIADAPEWVHLMPAGEVVARDGRQFVNSDPEAIIADFQARNVDLPIDFEHQQSKARLIGKSFNRAACAASS